MYGSKNDARQMSRKFTRIPGSQCKQFRHDRMPNYAPARMVRLVEGEGVAVGRFFQNCHLLCPPWRVGQTTYLFHK